MGDKYDGKGSFVDQMTAKLLQYQIQKIRREDNAANVNHGRQQKEIQAKQTLISIDNENQHSKMSSEDIYIGGWSNYKIPEKIQERISMTKKKKKTHTIERGQYLRYNPELYRQSCSYNSRSQKIIPKLKVILNQLQQPLNLPPKRRGSQSQAKMKNYIGMQALVIFNKEEIKPNARSQRKITTTIESALRGIQNKRPPSTNPNVKRQIIDNKQNYQKIKRNFGFNNQQCDVVYEKDILSHLVKANNQNKQEISPLTNMLNNYFTISTNEKKKSTHIKLGLDKLLS